MQSHQCNTCLQKPGVLALEFSQRAATSPKDSRALARDMKWITASIKPFTLDAIFDPQLRDRLERLPGYDSSGEIFRISPLRQRLAKLAQSSQLLLP